MPLAPDHNTEINEEPGSCVSLTWTPGSCATMWATEVARDTDVEFQVRIRPDRPVVIGRAEGHDVPYLDPAYKATRVLPGTRQSVMKQDGHDGDITVSRGHFMLRADPGGIVFVNGVPRRGGGIRPPMNGTWMLAPTYRELDPEETYLIEHGHGATFWLPNGTQVRIDAR
jgi:hypothetical protein